MLKLIYTVLVVESRILNASQIIYVKTLIFLKIIQTIHQQSQLHCWCIVWMIFTYTSRNRMCPIGIKLIFLINSVSSIWWDLKEALYDSMISHMWRFRAVLVMCNWSFVKQYRGCHCYVIFQNPVALWRSGFWYTLSIYVQL
jgi:hypothetical protein